MSNSLQFVLKHYPQRTFAKHTGIIKTSTCLWTSARSALPLSVFNQTPPLFETSFMDNPLGDTITGGRSTGVMSGSGSMFSLNSQWNPGYSVGHGLQPASQWTPFLPHFVQWCVTASPSGSWLVSQFDEGLWQQWSLPSTEISFWHITVLNSSQFDPNMPFDFILTECPRIRWFPWFPFLVTRNFKISYFIIISLNICNANLCRWS